MIRIAVFLVSIITLATHPNVFAQPAKTPKHYPQVFRDSGYSTVTIVRDTLDGEVTQEQTIKTVSYHTASDWSDEALLFPKIILIAENNTEYISMSMEGEKGTIELTARSETDNFRKPIWKKKIEANQVEYNNDYLCATEFGCCAAEPGKMLFRYNDGKKLMDLSSELAIVSIPNTHLQRYIGILSREAALPQPEFDSDNTYAGLLTYMDPVSLKRQQIVFEYDSVAMTEVWFDSISFTPDSARDRNNYQTKNELRLWSADAKKDPNEIGGFTINITIEWGKEPLTIHIPVVNDKLVFPAVDSDVVRVKFR